MPTNSHNFRDLYETIGVDLSDLGCVMLDVQPLPVRESLAELPEDALFTSPDPKKFWIKGPVGQEGGHVTLLYGILKQLWREVDAAGEYFGAIEQVLTGWEQPEELQLGPVLQWPDPAGGPSTTLVAEVRITPELLDAHQRLSLLPHVDTFLDYHPHVTLAYVKSQYAERAAEALDFGIGGVVRTTNLNYGHGA